MDRTIHIIGSLEIILGGAMTAYPLFAPQWVGMVVALAGVVSFIWAVFFYKRGAIRDRRYKWKSEWKFSFQREGWAPYRRLMKMPDATAFAYEKTQKNDMSFVAEKMTKWGSSVLGYYAVSMTHQGGVSLFGTKPPITRVRHIPLSELRTCHFNEEVSALTRTVGGEIIYTNLMVRRVDLTRWIKTKGREKYFEE